MKHFLFVVTAGVWICISAASAQTVKTVNSDGSLSIKNADGKTVVVPMDGKTPYGEIIAGDNTVLRRQPFDVRIVYNEKCSDDILEGALKDFYSQLSEVLRAKVTAKNFKYTVPLTVEVSYCRFSETGYCKRKNAKELSVRFLANGAEVKVLAIDPLKIVNDAERKNCVEKVLREFVVIASK